MFLTPSTNCGRRKSLRPFTDTRSISHGYTGRGVFVGLVTRRPLVGTVYCNIVTTVLSNGPNHPCRVHGTNPVLETLEDGPGGLKRVHGKETTKPKHRKAVLNSTSYILYTCKHRLVSMHPPAQTTQEDHLVSWTPIGTPGSCPHHPD